MAKTTLKDIAKKARVSITTVSRVLNNKKSNIPVSDSTKNKIKKIAKELNYHPNQNARALVSHKSKMIGLVLNKTLDPFFTKIIIGAEHYARTKGYRLVLSTTDFEPAEKVIEVLFNQNIVDGVLIGASTNIINNEEFIKTINNNNIPTVLVTNSFGNIPSVRVDSYQGAYMATEYLIKSGNRKIATITGPDLDRIVDSKERLKGFKECLIDNHLELKPEYIQNGNFSYESGYLATKKLLALDNPPEAIFIAEDQMALGAISAATELEKNIPNDLAIIGFDNIIQAKYSNPKLSTVSQPM